MKLRGVDIRWHDRFELVYALRHTLGFMREDELFSHIAKLWQAVKQGGYFILNIPYTLEAGVKNLPISKWEEKEGVYSLVDKFITNDNVKKERCVIIDSNANRIEEYIEEQRYYKWQEIIDLLECCGVQDVQSLRDFDGNLATNGEECRTFLARKK